MMARVMTSAVVVADTAEEAHGRFQSRTHFGNLDGLRCLSIVAVVWHHGPGLRLGGYAANGAMGVPLFFAISGFLITTLLLREWERSGTISLVGFYARRSLRIFPLYYSVLALYAALLWLTARDAPASRQFFDNLPFFLTYTSNWFVGSVGTFAFSWSLAAEEQFYATWPWAVRYLTPVRAVWFVAGLLVMALWWNLRGPVPTRASWPLAVVASLQMAICWGCLLAFALRSRTGFALAWRVIGHRAAGPLLLGAILLALALPFRTVTVHLLFAGLVGACVIREDAGLAALLRMKPIVHIGTISYGVYMLHGLVYNALDLVGRRLPGGWQAHGVDGFAAALLVTTAVATLSFQQFESRFLRLKARFAHVDPARVATSGSRSLT